jgi:hypothetical protein
VTVGSLTAVIVSVVVAVTAVWAGLFVALWTNYPASFFIVAIIFLEYVCVRGVGALRDTALLQAVETPEREGVLSLRNASLTASISQILFVGGAALLAVSLLAYPGAAWTPGGLYAHAFWAVVALASAAVLGAAASLLYFSGFRKMAASSREFTGPAFLTLVGLLGIGFTAGGLGLFLSGVGLASSAYGLAPVAELFGAPLIGLGAVFAVVGLVGQAMGAWRVAVRYREGALRAGALLMILPLAGYCVSFLGFRRALAHGPAPAPSGLPG